jgi:hypothetical protein
MALAAGHASQRTAIVSIAARLRCSAPTIQICAGSAAKVGVETGPVMPWLVYPVHAADLGVVRIKARHDHAAMLAVQSNQNQPRAYRGIVDNA